MAVLIPFDITKSKLARKQPVATKKIFVMTVRIIEYVWKNNSYFLIEEQNNSRQKEEYYVLRPSQYKIIRQGKSIVNWKPFDHQILDTLKYCQLSKERKIL